MVYCIRGYVMVCEKCKNEIGFYFGTCIRCHWNKDSGFKKVLVNVEELSKLIPKEKLEEFIDKHDSRYNSNRVKV